MGEPGERPASGSRHERNVNLGHAVERRWNNLTPQKTPAGAPLTERPCRRTAPSDPASPERRRPQRHASQQGQQTPEDFAQEVSRDEADCHRHGLPVEPQAAIAHNEGLA
jgi:hypothetical protein